MASASTSETKEFIREISEAQMIPWDPVAWRVPFKVTSDDYAGSVCDCMRTSNSHHFTFLLFIPNLLLVELEVCEP